MATTAGILTRVRLELADQGQSFSTTAISDGVTLRYELPMQPVSAFGLSVNSIINGTPAALTYTLDAQNGVITLATAPANGVTINTQGTAYRYFSDADITTFINTAVSQHLHNRTDPYGRPVTLATLPSVEDYLIALLATIEALYVLLTDTSYDIDIITPEGVSIPRSQRRQALMQLIEERQTQYKELAAALNVGLNRIEMFTLRRISRSTGKLVPVYVAQELDDIQPARRVYTPIDSDGAAPLVLPDVPTMALTLTEGASYTQDIVLGVDVTGKTLNAYLKTYPHTNASRAKFALTVTDAPSGSITITLARTLTFLPPTLFWELIARDPNGDVHTLMQGDVTVIQQGVF